MRTKSEVPRAAARQAALRYVGGTQPGIRRIRRGRGFVYVKGDRIVRDRATVARIRKSSEPVISRAS